jgi:lipopolysaccharide export system permease protein
LRILDRYILRKFLGTFFFLLIIIMLVAIVFDLSEKTEDFAGTKASTREIILDYYVNFVVFYANRFSGLFIFLAVLLFTSRLAHRSEVIAMLSSGVTFPRLMRPYFVGATLLTALSLVVNHLVLPRANKVRLDFEEAYIRSTFTVSDRNLHREIAPGTIVYTEVYGARERTMFRMSLEQWEGDSLLGLLTADRAVYDSITGHWQVFDWTLRHLGPHGDRLRTGYQLDTVIPLKPSDFGQRAETAMAMGTSEIDDYIAKRRAQGDGKVGAFLVEKHQRTAYPFASYIFTLIGVGIASRKVRGGTGLHLALGVMLVLVYFFVVQFTTVAATNAGLDPFLAVWLPNIGYALFGIWIYRTAPK